MDLIIHNIDMPFFFLSCFICTMYVCMYVSISVFFSTYPYFKAGIHWFPKGSHALYLPLFDFGYFGPYWLNI